MLLGGNSYHFIQQKLCFYGVKRHVLVRNWYKNMPFLYFLQNLKNGGPSRKRFEVPLPLLTPFVGTLSTTPLNPCLK